MTTPKISSYNEWDPLEEIIVGTIDGVTAPVLTHDSVAYARDKWLKPGGLMLPNRATIMLGLYKPSSDLDHTHFVRAKFEKEMAEWNETVTDLQGLDVDYSSFTDELKRDLSDHFLKNAIRVNYLSPDNLASDSQRVLEFNRDFQFSVTKHAKITGFLGWFTTDFPNGVVLNTGPGSTYNHWGQQLYPLKESFQVAPGDKVKGTITLRRNHEESRLNVVEFKYQVGEGSQQTALFNMGAVEHMHKGSKSVLFS